MGGAREGSSSRSQAGRSKRLAPRSLPGGCEGESIAVLPGRTVQMFGPQIFIWSARKGDVHPAMSLDIRSESGRAEERSVTGLGATYNVSMHSSPQDSTTRNNMLIRPRSQRRRCCLKFQYFFGSAGSGRSI
jgi:hypothetical protein